MRPKAILIASLPLANALSLANFQDITSILIPLTCQFSYDQQIPACTVADFEQDGCSPECTSALNSIANSVSQACSNVNVNSNTLLGIVKNGGILQALCPTRQATTTEAPPQQTTTAVQESAQPSFADSVTIPTKSPGVVVGTTSSKSTPIAQSAVSTTRTISSSSAVDSAPETTDIPPASTTLQSADNGIGGGPATTTSENAASTTSKDDSSPTKKAQSDTGGGSGGGSPFDISSNDGERLERAPMLAFVVATWACIFLGR